MARIQYRPSAQRRGFSAPQLSTAGIARMREDSNRVINHMEKLRRAEQAQRDRELAAMQDDAAYQERMMKENQKIRLYNETQQAKAQQQAPTEGPGEVFTGLLQFSQTLAKAVTEEANRQTKRNVAAALAEPISIEQELETARARRAQTYGGIIQADNVVENAFRTGEDPIETTKSHVSNPAIVGRAAQVYDNRRATAIYSALRDDYLFSTEKQFTAADGTPFSGRETLADADLTRQFQARLREDLLIAMGNPNPTYLAEAFKEIDASNKIFVDRARTEQKKRYDAEVKQQVDTLFSSNERDNIALGVKQNIVNFGYPATVDRFVEELKKPSSNEQLFLNYSLKGDGVAFKDSHPGKAAEAVRERDKEQDRINRAKKRLDQDEFDSSIVANKEAILERMMNSQEDAETVLYQFEMAAANFGVEVPQFLKQMHKTAVKGNSRENKQKILQAYNDGSIYDLPNNLHDPDNIALAKELREKRGVEDYGELWPNLEKIVTSGAKSLANFSDPSGDATDMKVEVLKIEVRNWLKQDIKDGQSARGSQQRLQTLIDTARDGDPNVNPFSFRETSTGREFLKLGAKLKAETEYPEYVLQQAKGKDLGQMTSQPYLLFQDNQHEEALAAQEAGLPIPFTKAVRQIRDLYTQKGINVTLTQIHNAGVMANNSVSGKNLALLNPNAPMTAMMDGMSPQFMRDFENGLENGVVQPVQRALTSVTGAPPPRRPSIVLQNYDATPDERMRTTGDQYMSYMTTDLGLSTNHALGLLANMIRESSLRPAVPSGDDGGAGGLFQWYAGRQTPYVQQIVGAGDWKKQIEYALREPGEPGQEYLQQNFATPQEAADWWMRNWERPAHPDEDSVKHTEILRHWVN